MGPATAWAAAVSLLPAMIGPLSAAGEHAVTIALCGGGVISVPLDPASPPSEGGTPCCAKGCHSGRSRKNVDRTQ